MNTNQLKKFAQDARRKLLQQVGSRMELVLTTDSAELREKAVSLNNLKEAIKDSSKEQVIDKIAYTWFNRLMALRFMDANEYQPTGIKMVTPKEGFTLPEILEDAKQGQVPDELPVNKEHIYDLLDGKVPSSNAQNEVYKELLIGACNQLHSIFPFLFEKIDDFTELLLPDDLTSEFSIINDFVEGMQQEDCKEVEVIGWLYQFYISEKKDEVFASKSKVKKEDIPAATQLFTPRWIVEYMVQNTVGKLWLQNNRNSKLREHMQYFIESPSVETEDYLKVNSVEEITLLDQACGSGHILVYGFELLSKIYEEEGYNPSEIPQLIIEKNLHGFEIDERAAQLSGLALMMKARGYNRRVFRKKLKPNILQFKDVSFSPEELSKVLPKVWMDKSKEFQRDLELIGNATNFGSLIQPESSLKFLTDGLEEIEKQLEKNPDLFLQYLFNRLRLTVTQLVVLAKKYHCIVNNPPYMGGGKMNIILSKFVNKFFPKSKSDLMACFIEAGQKTLIQNGFQGLINQQSWMFHSSYTDLRKYLLKNVQIDNLLHLGSGVFPEISGEVVKNVSVIFKNDKPKLPSLFFKLDKFKGLLKKKKLLTILGNEDHSVDQYLIPQSKLLKIPNNPIAYWMSDSFEKLLDQDSISDFFISDGQILTGNNDKFLKYIWEVGKNDISQKKWQLHTKGGDFRKWYGNIDRVVRWDKVTRDYYRSNKTARILSSKYWDRSGIVWNGSSSPGNFGVRLLRKEDSFNKAAPGIFLIEPTDSETIYLGILNSKITKRFLEFVSGSTYNAIEDILSFPVIIPEDYFELQSIIEECIKISEEEWNLKEFSINFEKNGLIKMNSNNIQAATNSFKEYWSKKFTKIHKNEEQINFELIKLYNLEKELTSEVGFKEITILKDETKIVNGQLVFQEDEVFQQFMSYAVGCMFGRYSLDKDGLILANQGETLEDYLEKVYGGQAEPVEAFLPDYDNIIPVLDDEWFEDDIVNRFYEFLKASFGKENFDKNLAFVEECLGKDIRKYFVKDFYKDHVKRYKKRPIYWMYSSPKGSFNVLIYMHRYTPDTLNNILNSYLVEYREKLKSRIGQLDHIIESGSPAEQTRADKDKDKLNIILLELQEYEREILYPLATERISIDLDDGVLVNYNKFGKAIKEVLGLNDKKTKDKVRKFDWVDVEQLV